MKLIKAWMVALSFIGIAGVAPVHAADAYPDRTVRLVVPFPPGGATDIIGRGIADRLSQALGQTFIVENRSGASGNIGMEAVARAAPDGYTLVIGAPQTLTINPLLFKNSTFEPTKALDPIVVIATVPNVLIVNADLPIDSVQDLIGYSQERPGATNYGSPSTGSTAHLSAELFKSLAKLDIAHIPYRGSAPALTDLVGGQVEMMFDNLPASLPHIQSGRVKALAVTTKQRTRSAPDLPTMEEAGVEGFESQGWFSILAPAGTPEAILLKINAEVNKILKTESFDAQLAKLGAEAHGGTIEDFRDLIENETARWREVIEFADIEIE